MGIVARIRRIGATAVVVVIVSSLAPSVAVGQATYRLACDLLPEADVSEILGADVAAVREGSRAACTYQSGNAKPVVIRLDHRDSLANYGDVKPTTVAGLPTISGTSSKGGAAIAELPDGGTLSAEVTLKGVRPKAAEKIARGLLEAILAAGPVTAQPPDRGDPQPLYLVDPMCETLTNEMVDELVGGSNEGSPPGSNDQQCGYLPSGLTVYLTRDDFKFVDLGDYGSEELTVAERPARWDGLEQQLSVDAGAGRVLAIDLVGQDTVDASETTLAVAETLLPLLSTEPPPLPAECPLLVDVVSGLTGLQAGDVSAAGTSCQYVDATRPNSGVIVMQDTAADPKAFATRYGVPGRLKKADVAGQPALTMDRAGATIIIVDLDGLPDGDGKVLAIQVGGLPDGFESPTVARALADAIIAEM